MAGIKTKQKTICWVNRVKRFYRSWMVDSSPVGGDLRSSDEIAYMKRKKRLFCVYIWEMGVGWSDALGRVISIERGEKEGPQRAWWWWLGSNLSDLLHLVLPSPLHPPPCASPRRSSFPLPPRLPECDPPHPSPVASRVSLSMSRLLWRKEISIDLPIS